MLIEYYKRGINMLEFPEVLSISGQLRNNIVGKKLREIGHI